MKIVVCVKQVPDSWAEKTLSRRPHPRPRVRRRRHERDRRVRASRRRFGCRRRTAARSPCSRWARTRPPRPSARPCRWAPTRACTSSTTGCTARTRWPPRWRWPRRSRTVEYDLVILAAASPPTPAMSVVPAMLAERLGLPQLTFATLGRGRRRHGHDQAPDRVRLRRRRGPDARADQRGREDQRAALPVVQGDHGGQEEAGETLDAGRPGRDPRPRSGLGCRLVGRRGGRARPAEGARAPSSRTRATAACIAEFLAAQKFI